MLCSYLLISVNFQETFLHKLIDMDCQRTTRQSEQNGELIYYSSRNCKLAPIETCNPCAVMLVIMAGNGNRLRRIHHQHRSMQQQKEAVWMCLHHALLIEIHYNHQTSILELPGWDGQPSVRNHSKTHTFCHILHRRPSIPMVNSLESLTTQTKGLTVTRQFTNWIFPTRKVVNCWRRLSWSLFSRKHNWNSKRRFTSGMLHQTLISFHNVKP